MQVIMMIVALFQRTALSYGKMFTLMGTIIGEGGIVLKATLVTLGQKKYKHISAHFQAGVLHLVAAAAEFKKGVNALELAVKENPSDFVVAIDFGTKLKTELPASLEECFKGLEEIGKGVNFKAKVPAFVRESGEYMDLINEGYLGSYTEVDEKAFKEILVKNNDGLPESLIRDLGEAQESIEVKGWARHIFIEVKDEKETIHRYILWADEFKFDELIPENVTVVEEKGKEDWKIQFIEVNGVIYKIDRTPKMTPEEVAAGNEFAAELDKKYGTDEPEDKSEE
jgi:hypothetical protein